MNTFKFHLNPLSRLSVVCLAAFLCAAAPAQAAPQTYTNSIGMEFVPIPAGSFMMGCDGPEPACPPGNEPRRRVTITRPFYLGKYEVTQAQWEAVMGSNPSHFKGANRPVDTVSWEDVQTFILRLNQREGGRRYRLPTEAEWEYAARAGSTTAYYFGNDESQLGRYAWCEEAYHIGHHPVGQKLPNAWGLYDMYGNVWEWVWDWYASKPTGEAQDPTGPRAGDVHVLRGGGFNRLPSHCVSYSRTYGGRSSEHGFRLVLSPRQ